MGSAILSRNSNLCGSPFSAYLTRPVSCSTGRRNLHTTRMRQGKSLSCDMRCISNICTFCSYSGEYRSMRVLTTTCMLSYATLSAGLNRLLSEFRAVSSVLFFGDTRTMLTFISSTMDRAIMLRDSMSRHCRLRPPRTKVNRLQCKTCNNPCIYTLPM